MALPPGLRFHPTDEELVTYYLRNRVMGIDIDLIASVIADIDVYKSEPWDLCQHSRLPRLCDKDKEFFFFSSRDKKYPNGKRTNRAMEAGFWKVTGRDRTVKKGSKKIIGMRKTLVFYLGRAPNHERTNWIMYEYRLDGDEWESTNVSKDRYVLCRIMKKDKFIPGKNDLNHPEEQADCGDCPSESSCIENEVGTVPVPPSGGAPAMWGNFDDFHRNLDSLPHVYGNLPLQDEEIELDLPTSEHLDCYGDSLPESSPTADKVGPLASPSNASATWRSFDDVDWTSLPQIDGLNLQSLEDEFLRH